MSRTNGKRCKSRNRVPAPRRSKKQANAIDQSMFRNVKKLRACLRDILGLEAVLCQCTDAYKDKGEVDPCCQAHEWKREVEGVIKHYRLKLENMHEADVYFIQGQETLRIKIGVAKDPQKRLANLQVGSAERLVLVGILFGMGVAKERQLHGRFIADEVHGEWFKPSRKLVEYIKQDAFVVSEPRRSHVINVTDL